MKSVVTLTMNPAIDTSASVDEIIPQKKLRCGNPLNEPGGGGINVSRAMKRLGGESLCFYTAGGPYGSILTELLDAEDIPHEPISIQGATRESIMILEESTRRQFRFSMPGPTLIEEEWERCLEIFTRLNLRPDYIVASGRLPSGVPDDFYVRLAKVAKNLNARFILDTSGQALREAVKGDIFLIKVNVREFQDLIGKTLENDDDRVSLAEELINKGKVENVVISLEERGAILISREGTERVHVPPVEVNSTVGAGDSMVAGLVLGLAQGKSKKEALYLGVASGTAAAMTPGTELCRREDAQLLYKELIKDA